MEDEDSCFLYDGAGIGSVLEVIASICKHISTTDANGSLYVFFIGTEDSGSQCFSLLCTDGEAVAAGTGTKVVLAFHT